MKLVKLGSQIFVFSIFVLSLASCDCEEEKQKLDLAEQNYTRALQNRTNELDKAIAAGRFDCLQQ